MTIKNKELKIIGAIGDIHTEEQLLEKTVDFLKSQNFVQQFVQFYEFLEYRAIAEAERVSLTALIC